MLKSIQVRLNLIYFAFTILLLISVGATYWGVEAQRQDALVINLAGRQRMLIQQIARLTLESQTVPSESVHNLLEETNVTFEKTLIALRDGGPAPYTPDSTVNLTGTKDAKIQKAIDDLSLAWKEFESSIKPIGTTTSEVSPEMVNEQAIILVAKADLVVRLFQAEAVTKVNLLRSIQLVFLAFALVLLVIGGWVTRQSLLTPLNELKIATNRLSNNDLQTPILIHGPEEMRALSNTIDRMRENLLSSQRELVALNNSLEKIVSQRNLELESLNDISHEIISQLDIHQVLNLVTEKARLLLGADIATLCLLNTEDQWLELRALSGPHEAIAKERTSAIGELATTILHGHEALPCANGECPGSCQMLESTYRTSHLAAPLRVGERVIGAFCVGSPYPNRFSDGSAKSLTKLANTASIALENARLYSQAERVATLEERNRIAADMHDGIGQNLSYLGLMTDQIVDYLSEGQNAEAFESLQIAREKIDQTALDIREAINHLLVESPLNQDLGVNLEKSVKDFKSENQLLIEFHNELSTPVQCSREITEQVIKIVIEALTNTIRHSEAKQVTVTLGNHKDELQTIITDNGRGFSSNQGNQENHFGLKVMEVRANYINGKLIVESKPGFGTKVILKWPAYQKGEL